MWLKIGFNCPKLPRSAQIFFGNIIALLILLKFGYYEFGYHIENRILLPKITKKRSNCLCKPNSFTDFTQIRLLWIWLLYDIFLVWKCNYLERYMVQWSRKIIYPLMRSSTLAIRSSRAIVLFNWSASRLFISDLESLLSRWIVFKVWTMFRERTSSAESAEFSDHEKIFFITYPCQMFLFISFFSYRS